MIRIRRIDRQSIHLAVDSAGAGELAVVASQLNLRHSTPQLSVVYDTGLVRRKRGVLRSGWLSLLVGENTMTSSSPGVLSWALEADGLDHLITSLGGYLTSGYFDSAEFWHVNAAKRREMDTVYLLDLAHDELPCTKSKNSNAR